jgi:hypothetical protein
MPSTVTCRRGNLGDLARLKFARDLPATSKAIEFNVVGLGHEVWIAVEENTIVGLTVLSRSTVTHRTILYIQVSESHKNLGIGTIQTVLETYPDSEFSVIPFEGTEGFCRRLGFTSSGRRKMRKAPNERC